MNDNNETVIDYLDERFHMHPEDLICIKNGEECESNGCCWTYRRIKKFYPCVDGIDNLLSACKYGHIDIVERSLEYFKSRKEDFKDFLSKYALNTAIRYGHIDIVKLLIRFGVDVKVNNSDSITVASKYNRIKIVKLLIEHGASVKDAIGIIYASQMGNLELFKLLIEHVMTLINVIIIL